MGIDGVFQPGRPMQDIVEFIQQAPPLRAEAR
jgi:hypothetical protein